MFPSITNAACKIDFGLPKGHRAVLLGDIASPGIIQYHYLFLVFDQHEQICLAVGAEWNKLVPENKQCPVLGCFTPKTHTNYGQSSLWLDEALFLLDAIKIVREQLNISDLKLTEGEIWALSLLRADNKVPL